MSKKNGKLSRKFEFKGFENLEFSAAEKAALGPELDLADERLFDNLVILTEADYKLGLCWDEYHEVYQISATCKDTKSPYWGYCFTLRHSDLARGVSVVRHVLDTLLATELYQLSTKQNMYDW